MKKTFLALACAVAAICACNKESEPTLVTVPTPFTGTVKAGIPESITVTGTGFQANDTLYVAWSETDFELITAYTITDSEVKLGIDAYSASKGKTAKIILYRDGKKEAITGDITVTEPTAADGFVIKDKALVESLKFHNGDIRAMFGPCNLLDVEAAKALVKDTQCDNEWGLLACDGTGATTFEGIEVFESIGKGLKTMADQEYGNFICWGSGNVKEMDFSNWNAYVQVRAASCGSLEKVILGPNMKGGDFEGSPIKYFDMHLAKGADWVMNIGNKVDAEAHPDYQGVEYCNLARTYVEGGNYGVDFNHWRGSGNVKDIKFAPNAEIHVDTELIMHQWSGGGVVAAIKTAWKNGATVIVHNTFDYDTFVEVEAYSVNPNALNKTCGEGCCPPDEF